MRSSLRPPLGTLRIEKATGPPAQRKSRAFAAQAAEAANLLWDAQRPVKVDLKTYRWAVASPVLQASAFVVLGAAADLATKAWAQSRLAGGHDITLGGGLLRLQLVVNHGGAVGLGARFEAGVV